MTSENVVFQLPGAHHRRTWCRVNEGNYFQNVCLVYVLRATKLLSPAVFCGAESNEYNLNISKVCYSNFRSEILSS
jgi:hypothetical protein